MRSRLYVIDSHGQLYASYFAIKGLTTPRGEPIGAAFGFMATLLKILREEKPEYLAACFDLPGPTHRHAAYAEYKAQREAMPEDLRPQIDRVRDILKLLGIPAVESPGFEADDCIAAMVERGRQADLDVVIVSRDKDLEQLVGPGVTMLRTNLDTKSFEHLDAEAIFKKRGVQPAQMLDVLSLMGDASDNIPGVPGIGPKTATKLVAEYGSLDAILAHADEIKGAVGDRLRTHREDALRSRSLVRLDPAAPLTIAPLDCRTPQEFDREGVVALFRSLGFNKFIDELKLVGGGTSEKIRCHVVDTPEKLADLAAKLAAQPAFAFDTETTSLVPQQARLVGLSFAWSGEEGYYVPLAGPEADRCLPLEAVRAAIGPILGGGVQLDTLLPSEPQKTVIPSESPKAVIPGESPKAVIPSERSESRNLAVGQPSATAAPLAAVPSRGKSRGRGRQADAGATLFDLAGEPAAQPAPADKPSVAPLMPQLPAVPVAVQIKNLKSKIKNGAPRLLVGQNIKYDMLVCRQHGMDLAEPLFDTMVAAYLANPGRREYGIDALALDYFSFKKIPTETLLGPKCKDRTMDACPIDTVAEYAVEDAVVAWRLRERLEPELAEQGLTALSRDVEMPLVPVLASMEETGVAVDTSVLTDIAANLGARLEKLEGEIHAAAGHPFSINSPQQLATILFDELGLKSGRKTASKSRPSTDADVLEELAALHPLPRLILEYRQLSKLKGTYVDALPKLINPATSRIHTSFNQTVAATGRLSSSDPNLQNIPIRTDEGRQVRRAFVPGRAGWVLLAADYSQIELRMLAHYSGDPALVRAFAEDRDIHTFVAHQIFGVPEAEVTDEQRRRAKIVNFSLIYGKTAYGLSRDLGISVSEAETFIDEYFARYAGVRAFTADVLARCQRDGYVTTILGRRRPIEGVTTMDPKRLNFPERTAINTVIQGSAADLIKIAMNRIWRRARNEPKPSRLLIQIHDELIFETPEADLATEQAWITAEMVGAMPLKVPLKVNVAWGRNWMEAE
jgi:DNA polymerase-1